MTKVLLVFNLENVLCSFNTEKSTGLAQVQDPNSLKIRNEIQDFCHFLFIRNKLHIKVGVWTSVSAEKTEFLCKKVFFDYHRHLLFKYSSPNQSVPIDLARIWHNYPGFSQANTLYMDTSSTSASPNTNILEFPPFADDNCLPLFQEYLRFFSFQYLEGRVTEIDKFAGRVKFLDYYTEKSRLYRGKPTGEAFRFW